MRGLLFKLKSRHAMSNVELSRRLRSEELRVEELRADFVDLDKRFRQFVQATGYEIDKMKDERTPPNP
jgi:predicted transcriptional regulator